MLVFPLILSLQLLSPPGEGTPRDHVKLTSLSLPMGSGTAPCAMN